jgi:hypothetical protein
MTITDLLKVNVSRYRHDDHDIDYESQESKLESLYYWSEEKSNGVDDEPSRNRSAATSISLVDCFPPLPIRQANQKYQNSPKTSIYYCHQSSTYIEEVEEEKVAEISIDIIDRPLAIDKEETLALQMTAYFPDECGVEAAENWLDNCLQEDDIAVQIQVDTIDSSGNYCNYQQPSMNPILLESTSSTKNPVSQSQLDYKYVQASPYTDHEISSPIREDDIYFDTYFNDEEACNDDHVNKNLFKTTTSYEFSQQQQQQ